MSQYTMITSGGLNEIDNAHQNGTLIELAFYVPVYDYRIDTNILPVDTTIVASEISSCTDVGDTYPQGEIIWNISPDDIYEVSNTDNHLVFGGDETISHLTNTHEIANYLHSSKLAINKFNNSAISTYYTADTVTAPDTTGNKWTFSNDGYKAPMYVATSSDGYGPEDLALPDIENLYGGIRFREVFDNGNSIGNYNVNIEIEKGVVKFNKVALYGIKRSASGKLIDVKPFLFAQGTFLDTHVIQTGVNGLTSVQLDFQMDLLAPQIDFDDILFSTSGDYWEHYVADDDIYGLQNDETVYISSKLAVNETGNLPDDTEFRSVSKLFTATSSRLSKENYSAERNTPQLAIQYVDNTTSVTENYDKYRTTFRVETSGNCEVELYKAGDETITSASFMPRFTRFIDIGDTTHKWYGMSLSDKLYCYSCSDDADSSNDSCEDGYICIETESNKTILSNATTPTSIDKYKGGKFKNMDMFLGPIYRDNDDGIIENPYYLHSNLSNPVSYYLSPIGGSEDVHNRASDTIIRSLDTDMIMVNIDKSHVHDVELNTAEKIIALCKDTKDADTAIQEYMDDEKDMLLFVNGWDSGAGNIYTHGNILPTANNKYKLGNISNDGAKVYNGVYTFAIQAPHADDIGEFNIGNPRQLKIYGHVVPEIEGLKIKENANGDQWDEITSISIGNESESSYVNAGYITQLYVDSIDNVESIGSNTSKVKDIWLENIHPLYCDLWPHNAFKSWVKEWKAIWKPIQNYEYKNEFWINRNASNQNSTLSEFGIKATGLEDEDSIIQNRVNVSCTVSHDIKYYSFGSSEMVVGGTYCILKGLMRNILEIPTTQTFHKMDDEFLDIIIRKDKYAKQIGLTGSYNKTTDELTFVYNSMPSNLSVVNGGTLRIIGTFAFTYNG